MKNIFRTILLVGLISSFSNLKAQSQDTLLAYKLYKVEFDIKFGKVNPEILNQIEISQYLSMRHPTQRIEVSDDITGLTLIIFSEEELQIVREPAYNYTNLTNEISSKTP